jgi:hypothetical protein
LINENKSVLLIVKPLKMKIKILFILIALLAFESNAQQLELFDRNWYATEMVIEGNTIPIPVLHANPPSDCSIGVKFFYDENLNIADVDIGICQACVAFVKNLTNTTFETDSYACLAWDDIGPCFAGSSQALCSAGILDEFEIKQGEFFATFDELITYTINDYGNNLYGLLLEKSNGDFIEYNTEEILSIQENEILTFSIVPNPASNTLKLTGLKTEVESIVIYTLNGNKISIVSETNTYDVSNLANGLYFISITSVDGQKAVQKFIKK